MKTIAIEEHFKIPAIIEANSGGAQEKAFKLFGSTGIYSTGEDSEVSAGSLDIGLKRLAAMDADGIDVQVLSLNQPATENLEPELAVKLAAMANDKIAAAVTAHPTRFGGFATLPMPNPKASAAELERMVTNHGFLGALIHGHIRGRYLDDQFFWPVFEMAEKLDVPIYLHPKRPPQAVEDACYGGFETMVSEILATTGWGWHVDTGLHVLRLILGGVFDRFPKLQIIIGHMGEALPSMIWRANSELGPAAKYLKRRVIDYFQQNIHVTTSGYYAAPDGSIDYAALERNRPPAALTARRRCPWSGSDQIWRCSLKGRRRGPNHRSRVGSAAGRISPCRADAARWCAWRSGGRDRASAAGPCAGRVSGIHNHFPPCRDRGPVPCAAARTAR
jgi:uncharacterized protein